ncbi:MAG: hypothetical protein PUB76_03080 [Oscillospiraceae bacterium]|nr:hypothetical protein [Oscillospiraceae bacterium]MDD6084946.1 hypothetical protein [Oscillospiraceae bacterium]MDY3256998.1 hypothetical protein [Ruminococcus callidus]
MNLINIQNILKTIKSSRKMTIYFSLIIISVLFLIFFNIIDNGENKESNTNNEINTESDYISNIESDLTKIISKIEGAGDTIVMVTSEGTSKYEYAKEEHNIKSADKNELEEKYIYGENDSPVTISIENPKITGVLVVCEGGDNSAVKEKIYKAVSTSLNIRTNQIYVTQKNKKENFR